ncbi:MAG: DUF2383 domain-containing protein [Paracoccaceae bacterium]
MADITDRTPVQAASNLIDDLADIISGYETMIEKAEPDLQPHIQRLHAIHESHAAELMECLATLGGQPDNPGSMMGMVHTTVASARNFFGALDQSALESILDGEDRLLRSYKGAADSAIAHDTLHDLLAKQHAALQEQVYALRRS